jgi:hypothetical protein
VENDGLNTEEGHSGRSWFGLNGTREWCYHDRPGLGLPPGVNDGTLLLPDVFVVPVPSLGVDGFTNTTQHSDGTEIVGLDVVFTETTKETDGGGSSVEVGNLVFLNGLPVAGWSRVNRGRLEDGSGDAIEERAVNDVTDGQ